MLNLVQASRYRLAIWCFTFLAIATFFVTLVDLRRLFSDQFAIIDSKDDGVHAQWLGSGADLSITENVPPSKPPGIRVVALVFYGRRDRVEILRCFLKKNMVENGGWLDEIRWVANTDNQEDLDYLDDVLKDSEYYTITRKDDSFTGGFGEAWYLLEPGSYTVKIDDDVVWLAEDTIPRVVTAKINNPDYLVVSANIINHPLMGWVHYHMGAIHPYLPDIEGLQNDMQSQNTNGSETKTPNHPSWKYTDYPTWEGSSEFTFNWESSPPADHHKWLRLPAANSAETTRQLRRTPIVGAEYSTWGNSLQSWAIAAQNHYSFLENLLDGKLNVYKFSPSRLWTTDYDRLSINLIVVNSDEILAQLPVPEDVVDEEWLTVVLPQNLGKSVGVETTALAAHFSFAFQRLLSTTDLLARYLDYAEENVCSRQSIKNPAVTSTKLAR